jgi:hypothetical protein
MLKKINLIVAFCFLFIVLPVQVLAYSAKSGEYDPPADSDYYKKKISWQLYFDNTTTKITIFQYDTSGTLQYQKDMDVKSNSTLWLDMKCKGTTTFNFYDSSGASLGFVQRGLDNGSYLDDSACDYSNPVSLSDYNEAQKQYASDTFGGTKSKLTDPPTADGSGGGTSSGGSGGTTDCSACQIFQAPEWNNYMSKLNDIMNAIPPPPNWSQVATTFTNSIVPAITNSLSNLLGSAPAAPSVPAQPSGTDDHGFNSSAPTMQDVPGLSGSTFDSGTIENSAPVIQQNSDPTGGFNLIQNPIASLPSFPTDALPKPGSTNAGDWGQNKPSQPDNPIPSNPVDTGTPDTGSAPKPADSGATPPAPGDSSGSAPKPSDNGSTPPSPSDSGGTPPSPGGSGGTGPSPSGDSYPGMKDYKPTPESPDGSGGDFSP